MRTGLVTSDLPSLEGVESLDRATAVARARLARSVGESDALEAEDPPQRVEMAVLVQHPEAAFGGGRGDQVVGGRQAATAPQLLRGHQGGATCARGHRRLRQRVEI